MSVVLWCIARFRSKVLPNHHTQQMSKLSTANCIKNTLRIIFTNPTIMFFALNNQTVWKKWARIVLFFANTQPTSSEPRSFHAPTNYRTKRLSILLALLIRHWHDAWHLGLAVQEHRQPVRFFAWHSSDLFFRLTYHAVDVNEIQNLDVHVSLELTTRSPDQISWRVVQPYHKTMQMSNPSSWLKCCPITGSRQTHPNHQSIQDRDHLIVAIIDTQISASLKNQPLLELRFDSYQSHIKIVKWSCINPHNSWWLWFVVHEHFSQLRTSFRIPDNEYNNSPLKSWHTTCSSNCKSFATSLAEPATQNVGERSKNMIFRDIASNVEHSPSELDRSNSFSHNLQRYSNCSAPLALMSTFRWNDLDAWCPLPRTFTVHLQLIHE